MLQQEAFVTFWLVGWSVFLQNIFFRSNLFVLEDWWSCPLQVFHIHPWLMSLHAIFLRKIELKCFRYQQAQSRLCKLGPGTVLKMRLFSFLMSFFFQVHLHFCWRSSSFLRSSSLLRMSSFLRLSSFSRLSSFLRLASFLGRLHFF